MGQMPKGPEKFEWMGLHKSLGVLALLLILLRITGRLFSRVVTAGHTLQDHIARLIHLLLYLMMLAMPISGVVMSWAGGRDTHFFSLLTLSGAREKLPAVAGFAHEIHVTLIYGFAALIVIHIAGFIYHQFIQKHDILHRISLRP